MNRFSVPIDRKGNWTLMGDHRSRHYLHLSVMPQHVRCQSRERPEPSLTLFVKTLVMVMVIVVIVVAVIVVVSVMSKRDGMCMTTNAPRRCKSLRLIIHRPVPVMLLFVVCCLLFVAFCSFVRLFVCSFVPSFHCGTPSSDNSTG